MHPGASGGVTFGFYVLSCALPRPQGPSAAGVPPCSNASAQAHAWTKIHQIVSVSMARSWAPLQPLSVAILKSNV